jgi:hypothetical protein
VGSCSSCGGGRVGPAAGGTVQAAAYQADPPRSWVVKYPNGAEQTFYQEWAANQALALSGGVLVSSTLPASEPASNTAGQQLPRPGEPDTP